MESASFLENLEAPKKIKKRGWLHRLEPGGSGALPDQVKICVKRLVRFTRQGLEWRSGANPSISAASCAVERGTHLHRRF